VDFHLTVPYYITIKQSHEVQDRLEAIVKKTLNTTEVEILVHMDPCIPQYCKICRMPECPVRKETNTGNVLWNGKKIISKASYIIGDADTEL